MANGLDRTPPVFNSPFWRDSFFWLFVASIVLWAFILWLLFF